ncbi:hypothetical protein HMPREF9136_2741 [Prevotella dentalis DSM 3688]|uniref:Uncharacterized protein n=1 Tax=Prevotella dentalis (strain ATCC 49559 / DSM 3688 / JCM 13448 / NCTC 12043 / ES 2772) TaxID=908937 RepID=F9D7B3_PREDD|nr:hypothetical protein HMPREF9136_2741 [Prevotella dentalis DSM 3688]
MGGQMPLNYVLSVFSMYLSYLIQNIFYFFSSFFSQETDLNPYCLTLCIFYYPL